MIRKIQQINSNSLNDLNIHPMDKINIYFKNNKYFVHTFRGMRLPLDKFVGNGTLKDLLFKLKDDRTNIDEICQILNKHKKFTLALNLEHILFSNASCYKMDDYIILFDTLNNCSTKKISMEDFCTILAACRYTLRDFQDVIEDDQKNEDFILQANRKQKITKEEITKIFLFMTPRLWEKFRFLFFDGILKFFLGAMNVHIRFFVEKSKEDLRHIQNICYLCVLSHAEQNTLSEETIGNIFDLSKQIDVIEDCNEIEDFQIDCKKVFDEFLNNWDRSFDLSAIDCIIAAFVAIRQTDAHTAMFKCRGIHLREDMRKNLYELFMTKCSNEEFGKKVFRLLKEAAEKSDVE